jgi:hypothetical protein
MIIVVDTETGEVRSHVAPNVKSDNPSRVIAGEVKWAGPAGD